MDEPPEALALALAFGAPAEPILRWVTELSGVRLEIGGDDLLAAGVPEGPAIGRALEETLRRKLDGLVTGRDEELQHGAGAGAVIDVLELPGARAVFSTRQGGVSEGPVQVAQPGPAHRRRARARDREPRPGWRARRGCPPTAS